MALYNFAGGSLTQLLFITGDIYAIMALTKLSHWTGLALQTQAGKLSSYQHWLD